MQQLVSNPSLANWSRPVIGLKTASMVDARPSGGLDGWWMVSGAGSIYRPVRTHACRG